MNPTIKNFNNGIWYLQCKDSDTLPSLSKFKAIHPELLVMSISTHLLGLPHSRFTETIISTEPRKEYYEEMAARFWTDSLWQRIADAANPDFSKSDVEKVVLLTNTSFDNHEMKFTAILKLKIGFAAITATYCPEHDSVKSASFAREAYFPQIVKGAFDAEEVVNLHFDGFGQESWAKDMYGNQPFVSTL